MENKNKKLNINSLHRYYVWANRMRIHFEEIFKKDPEPKYYQIEYTMYMSIWYGLLYVVIEGWQELKLTDDKINKLIESDNTNLLKRYRNGTFHYQKEYNDERFENFFKESETVNWVRSLNQEIGRWFLKNLHNKQNKNQISSSERKKRIHDES